MYSDDHNTLLGNESYKYMYNLLDSFYETDSSEKRMSIDSSSIGHMPVGVTLHVVELGVDLLEGMLFSFDIRESEDHSVRFPKYSAFIWCAPPNQAKNALGLDLDVVDVGLGLNIKAFIRATLEYRRFLAYELLSFYSYKALDIYSIFPIDQCSYANRVQPGSLLASQWKYNIWRDIVVQRCFGSMLELVGIDYSEAAFSAIMMLLIDPVKQAFNPLQEMVDTKDEHGWFEVI